MHKIVIGCLIASLASFSYAVQIPLLLYNYTGLTGNVFIGTSPQLLGPSIGSGGSNISWTPNVNGKQAIGLQSGSSAYLCYNDTSVISLSASQYVGDVISIFYGQPAPSGIACGCYGSACVYN